MRIGIGLLSVGLLAGPAWAQCEVQTLLPAPNATFENAFGSSVALDGDTLLVGDPQDPTLGEDAGAVHVFVRSGDDWVEEAVLYSTDPNPVDDRFGASVAIRGDVALVGAPLDGAGDRGSAHVFERSAGVWSHVQKLSHVDGEPDDFFGNAVALGPGLAVVGIPQVHVDGKEIGAVRCFELQGETWVQGQDLLPSDLPDERGFGLLFGSALALQGDRLFVGARHRNKQEGSVYVFERQAGAWIETAILTPDSCPVPFPCEFGGTIAVDGDALFVAASSEPAPNGSLGVGAVYGFEAEGTSWSQVSKRWPDDLWRGFGDGLAVLGDRLAVGATVPPTAQLQSGAVYLYERTGGDWALVAKLSSPLAVATNSESFGEDLVLGPDVLLVGAPAADDLSVNAGVVRVFAPDGFGKLLDVGGALSGATTPRLVGLGTTCPGYPNVEFLVRDGPASGQVTLVAGAPAIFAPFKGGTLVPAPAILVPPLPLDADGALTLSVAWPAGVPSGLTFWVQGWMADASGPKGFVATNGLAVVTP